MRQLSPEQRKKIGREPFPFEAVVNPTWRALSTRTKIAPEGCLSIRDLKVDVPRYREIEVEACTPERGAALAGRGLARSGRRS